MSINEVEYVHIKSVRKVTNIISILKKTMETPLVIFSHSQISKNSKKLAVKTLPHSSYIPLSLSLLSPVIVNLSTRLAVILKFPYLCRYSVSIQKEFN